MDCDWKVLFYIQTALWWGYHTDHLSQNWNGYSILDSETNFWKLKWNESHTKDTHTHTHEHLNTHTTHKQGEERREEILPWDFRGIQSPRWQNSQGPWSWSEHNQAWIFKAQHKMTKLKCLNWYISHHAPAALGPINVMFQVQHCEENVLCFHNMVEVLENGTFFGRLQRRT